MVFVKTPMADSRVVIWSSFFLVLTVNLGVAGQQMISWQADRSHCILPLLHFLGEEYDQSYMIRL